MSRRGAVVRSGREVTVRSGRLVTERSGRKMSRREAAEGAALTVEIHHVFHRAKQSGRSVPRTT